MAELPKEISEELIRTYGIQSLAVRPNSYSSYGESGFSAEELQKRFDKLPKEIATRLNELLSLMNKTDFASVLKAKINDESITFQALINGLISGEFANRLQVKPPASEPRPLNEMIDTLDKAIAALDEAIAAVKSGEIEAKGEVKQGETKPVSGEQVYNAIETAKEKAWEEAKKHADNPKGTVTDGESLPVSGGEIYNAIDAAKWVVRTDAYGYATNPNGDVAPDTSLPVSGGKIYTAIKSFADPLESRVDALEGAVMEGMPFYFTTVEDLAVKHDVPAAAMPYARLGKIGGHTRKCTNLLALVPNTELGTGTDGSAETEYRVWVDEDGYLTIDSNGNDTGISSVLELPEELFKNIPPNGATVSTYIRYVSGSANGGYAEGDAPAISFPWFTMREVLMTNGATYTNTGTYSGNGRTMQVVGVFDNLKLAITVVEGSTPVDDPVYYEGLKSAKVTAVKSYSANMIPFPYVGGSATVSGVSFEQREDGALVLNGTCTQTSVTDYMLMNRTSWPSGNYYITQIEGGASYSKNIFVWIKRANGADAYFTKGAFTLDDGDTISVSIRIGKDLGTVNNLVIKPMINRGTTALPFSKWGVIDTCTVSSEVQALDGYGIGINSDCANTVYLSNKTFEKKIDVVDLGSLIWQTAGTETSGKVRFVAGFANAVAPSSDSVIANIICERYKAESSTNVYQNAQGVAISKTGKIAIYDEQYSTASEATFKSAMQGVLLYYETATPSTEPITDIITGTAYLKVEGGCYIVAENEDGIEALLSMTYQVKTDPTI